MAGKAKPEARKSRKGRSPEMRDYYAGVLSKLISARQEAGLTQREVSLKLGMAHSYMNKCESGERAIDVAELWAICKIYRKPISFFAPDEP